MLGTLIERDDQIWGRAYSRAGDTKAAAKGDVA